MCAYFNCVNKTVKYLSRFTIRDVLFFGFTLLTECIEDSSQPFMMLHKFILSRDSLKRNAVCYNTNCEQAETLHYMNGLPFMTLDVFI